MKSTAIREAMKIARTMFAGALTLAISIAVIWSIQNSDVLVKTIRYPEAVRSLEIKVEMVSPIAKN